MPIPGGHHQNMDIQFPNFDYRIVWAAGFFDGEGTVSLSPHVDKKKNNRLVDKNLYRHLRVTCAQKYREPLEIFIELFGGRIHPDGSDRWKWQAESTTALNAIIKMLPYLIVKKIRAESAMKWQTTMRGDQQWNPLTEEEINIRKSCLETFGYANPKWRKISSQNDRIGQKDSPAFHSGQ